MNQPHPVRNRIAIALGVVALIVLALWIPSPLHNWFADSSIGGVPVKTAMMTLLILFTPPAILSSILRKFDVDYDDEVTDSTTNPVPVHNIVMHGSH